MNEADVGSAEPKPRSIILPSSSKFPGLRFEDDNVEVEDEEGDTLEAAADEDNRALQLAPE